MMSDLASIYSGINQNNCNCQKHLTFKEVAEEAFTKLGNAGMIEPGKAHSCSQCSQPYKAVADFMKIQQQS